VPALAVLMLTACNLNPGNSGLSFGETGTTASGNGAGESGTTGSGGDSDDTPDDGDDGDVEPPDDGDTGTGGTGTGGTGTGGTGTGDTTTGDTNTDETTSDTTTGPECGDGNVDDGEECDDGNASNEDACLDSCVEATCGDGYVWNGEEACDDGNASNEDACLDSCAAASCGDGYVWTGEEACDDGNASNEDACLDTCAAASCGDGYVWNGVEVCDDGTNDGSYGGCESDCLALASHCGDSVIDDADGELCDDGNVNNADGCTTACVFSTGFKVVFVTSTGHSANFGGLNGADATCQALADAASLPGTYKAWLSDVSESPSTRFTQASTPYILRDGTRVADDWADLTDGTLQHAIDLTEQLGAPPTFTSPCAGAGVPIVWTNTSFSGASQGPSSNCSSWTTTTGDTINGRSDRTDGTWATSCTNLPCSANANLYCFQQ
jgi:cysteine-rich repeat protein